jgi:hypothetical protein
MAAASITPTLIDRIQDRYGTPSTGTTAWICDGCVVT